MLPINEVDFLSKCIKENIRSDGRSFSEMRTLRLSLSFSQDAAHTFSADSSSKMPSIPNASIPSHKSSSNSSSSSSSGSGDGSSNSGRVYPAYGTCEAQLGKTRVITTCSYAITEPFEDRPTEGFLSFSVSYSLSSPLGLSSAPRVSEAFLERVLERTIKASKAIDTESLCILSGERVWSISASVRIIEDDGNVVDCASISCAAALLHFRKPEVSLDGLVLTDKDPVPLSIHHMPLCVSFAFVQDPESEMMYKILIDPLRMEEDYMGGFMTVAMNVHGEVCLVHKNGGTLVSDDVLPACMELTESRVREIYTSIRTAINQDAEDRRKRFHRTWAKAQ
eukprot:ANDGO_04999.mRNA.1 Exosome complex component rrp45